MARSNQLRDRYEALAWHVRHHGTKATPFVEPTAVEMAPKVASALRASVAEEAAALAQATYASAMKQRADQVYENVGLMQRAWRGLTGVAKEACYSEDRKHVLRSVDAVTQSQAAGD